MKNFVDTRPENVLRVLVLLAEARRLGYAIPQSLSQNIIFWTSDPNYLIKLIKFMNTERYACLKITQKMYGCYLKNQS
jgi:hypothetical protein